MSTPGPRAGTKPARIESLRLVETACWNELAAASRVREHGWRTMTLATLDGHWPQARAVTLREVDVAGHRLVFYCDDRSPKLAQIRQHPLGTLQAWCPRLSWQVRLKVRLEEEADEHARNARWSRLRLTPAAQDYLSPLAPGEPMGLPHEQHGAREHFTLVNAQTVAMDWLELHADGHRRAVFDDSGPRWVQP